MRFYLQKGRNYYSMSLLHTCLSMKQENMAVLAMDFIERDNQAAVSCADGYLTVWDLETCKLLRHTRLRDVQVGLRFCRSMDVLTSWGVDEFNHEIIVWDVDKLTVLHVLDGHCAPVKDICEVAPPPLAGTSESAEKPWDPILGEDTVVRTPQRRGFRLLSQCVLFFFLCASRDERHECLIGGLVQTRDVLPEIYFFARIVHSIPCSIPQTIIVRVILFPRVEFEVELPPMVNDPETEASAKCVAPPPPLVLGTPTQ